MCGRTACTLGRDALCGACAYREGGGRRRRPQWVDGPTGSGTYSPSYNFAPQSYGPVLVSSSHIVDHGVECCGERVVMPMKWGLVPSWHKGDPNSVPYKMINARVETLMEKASFRNPLNKGRRCVVLADGFYEWTTEKNQKKPYFVHFPQLKSVDFSKPDEEQMCESETEVKTEEGNQVGEWKGRKLLTMAGVFDIWKPSESGGPLYSYAVITVPSSHSLHFMHDRMPAVLNGEGAVRRWLDCGEVDVKAALAELKTEEDLEFYPVSTFVNSVGHNSPDCLQMLQSSPRKKSWLKDEKNYDKKVQATLSNFFKPQLAKEDIPASKKKKSM